MIDRMNEEKGIKSENLFETLGKATKPPSQQKQILLWLQAGNSLTAMQALNMFNCWNLKGRIYDIRVKFCTGENDVIETEMIKTKSGKWIAKYKLIQS